MKKIRMRMRKLAVLLLMISVFTTAFGETATPASAAPVIINYTLNGAESNITFNPDLDEPVEIILNANEDVYNWVSVKIENVDDSGIYKTYYPGDSCDGNPQCAQSWDGALSKGTLIVGSYRIKVKMKDEAENEFNEYLTPYVIIIGTVPSDIISPVRSNDSPAGELAAGTTETTLSLTTDENATCKYSTIVETEYDAMTDTFSTTGEMEHSTLITGLENGQSYSYYVRCQDTSENLNANIDDFPISFSVASETGNDLFVAVSYPADDSTDVSVSVKPYLEFSKALKVDTIIDASNIQLRKYAKLAADSTQVEVNLSLENNDKKVVFNLAENLDYETQYYFYIGSGVKDADGNPIESENKWLHGDRADHEFTTEISDTVSSDETPPVISNGLPTGELTAGTTETTLSLTTDENATCKYSTTAETEYDVMTDTFLITGETDHSTSITGLANGQSYMYYVKCQDELENTNVDDYEISFSVASPQSSGGSGGFTPSSVSSSNKPLTVLSFQKGEMTQKLNGENEVKVEIPKGSVKARTTFTASKGSLADGNAPKNKVGAFLFNGLAFNIEAVDLRGDAVRDFSENLTITLTVPDLPDDTSNLKLYYYDDENGEWIVITDIEFGDNTITFKINHLTQFAVFEIPESTVKGMSDTVLFDGDVIRNPGAQGMAQFDVYVVKIINGKKFKRLIINPDVFESYRHLDWENIKLVDQMVMDSFTLSNLARCCGANIKVDSFKVYRLIPKNDAGIKQHFNITAFEFETKGYDWDSVYIINTVDMNVYIPGPDII